MDKPFTFNKLTKAIAMRVRELYPGIRVHLEYPESGLELPCFVLRTTGGNLRRRISQDKQIRSISNERFSLEFYSLNVAELQQIGYEIRLLLDVVKDDDGVLYRCFQKNSMMAITENHVVLTFRVQTEPYVEKDPEEKMISLDLSERLM